ncbi:MAG: ferrous iron transport protein A [Candidatus Accumulibacter sp.]|jgi:ferrous iron transport protein A|nr:ferrous iron transport protein A [Accumulibacter sp.]
MNSAAASTLDRAAIGETMVVLGVEAPAGAPEWKRWLEEIGFVAGERVRLMVKAFPGGDPMVARVGQSTFALRRAEAACIAVAPGDAAGGSAPGDAAEEGA